MTSFAVANPASCRNVPALSPDSGDDASSEDDETSSWASEEDAGTSSASCDRGLGSSTTTRSSWMGSGEPWSKGGFCTRPRAADCDREKRVPCKHGPLKDKVLSGALVVYLSNESNCHQGSL